MQPRRIVPLVAAAVLASRAGAQGSAGDAQPPPSDHKESWYQKDAQKARELGQEGESAAKRGASKAGEGLNAGGQALNAKVVGTKTVTGRVTDVGNDQVTVSRNDGAPMQLRVTRSTKVTVRGQSASLGAVQRGDEVRASYAQSGGSATATKIEVNPPAGAPQGKNGSGASTR